MRSLVLLCVTSTALAARVPFVGVRTADIGAHFPHLADDFARRAIVDGSVNLNDSKDLSYLIDITLGGKKFTVQIDTGSSDLWVDGSVPNSQKTGESGNVTYAKGSASGPIKTAALVVAGITVSDQAFIEADTDSTNSPGIFGLGPATGSIVYQTFAGQADAAPPLDRIFALNSSSEGYITSTLGRSFDDPSSPFPGTLTIDEILPGYEAVLQQPKLEVTGTDVAEAQHWQVLLDANGMSVNGQAVTLPSTAVTSEQSTGKLTAVLDNGFSLPQLPRSMVDAIYAKAKGATFDSKNNIYVVPCDTEINITFTFGGIAYPVHPLDAVSPAGGQISDGCIGMFQPITFDSQGQLDMILGMAFLRNVYMLNSFGLMAVAAGFGAPAPYVQMLSVTNDSARTHAEFVNARVTKSSGSGSSGGGKKNGAAVSFRASVGGLLGAASLAALGLLA